MPKKGECVRFTNYEWEIKSPLLIHANVERILVPEDNGKQNPNASYTNKYQKRVACSCGYKLVCGDNKFSKKNPAVYSFTNSMIEESKCCTGIMRNHIDKELVMTKNDDEDFKSSTKC